MKDITVLFTAALPAELNSIKKEVKKLGIVWIKTKFFLTWVWNYKTLYSLKHYLDNLTDTPDFVVNIGLCGKTKSASSDDFQVYRILWAANNRELLCPVYIDFLKKQSILSSEKIVTQESDMQWEAYVDMESYATDLIATEEKIPYIILKRPFDSISEASRNIDPEKFTDCLEWFDYLLLLEKIRDLIKSNHSPEDEMQQEYLKDTLILYKLTFSEKEIWKKWYAKCIALWWDYKDFLESHKHLEKKEFLKKLTS